MGPDNLPTEAPKVLEQNIKTIAYLCNMGFMTNVNTFPKFHMVLYTSRNSGDYTWWFNFQKAFVNILHTISTIPSLNTVFLIEP